MANYKSDQVTKLDNVPQDKLMPNEGHGRVRIAYFKFTAPTGGLAAADTIELCEVPSGARLLGGFMTHGALGAARTLNIGDGTTADKYASGLDLAAAGFKYFNDSQALNYGEAVTSKTRMVGTLAGGTMAAGLILEGQFQYVAD